VLNEEEETQRDSVHETFWKPEEKADPKKKAKRPRKLHKEKPRVASQDAERTLDNSMWRGMNRRMWQYKFTAERAAQLKKLLIAGKLTLDVLLMSFGWLALWTDRQSAQWAFAMYLMYHQKCLVAMMSDHPCHQHWNGTLKGLRASRHEAIIRELLPMSNWECGPWNKSQNLQKKAGALWIVTCQSRKMICC